jgi:hypothetical protein
VDTWKNDFKSILNTRQTVAAFIPIISQLYGSIFFLYFAEGEVGGGVIANLKDKEAAEPDGLYNENFKDSRGLLLTMWTELFNRCMEPGVIRQKWRHSAVKILYKRRGDK